MARVIQVNGSVRDMEGHALGGVLVSNGEHVVQTDRDGCYAIEAAPIPPAAVAEGTERGRLGGHPFIFVAEPSGYSAEGAFYRSTPQTSGTLDFALARRPATVGPEFTLAHVTDTHVGTHDGRPVGADELNEDLERVRSETGPGLVVATGDLTDEGTLGELGAYGEVAELAEMTIFPVFGGHDGNQEMHGLPGWGATCTGNYQQVFGPVCYSFDRGGYHFVAYANEDYYFSAYDLIFKERWLRQDLSLQPEGRQSVMLMHAPPSRQLLDRLQGYNVTLVLHGHTHSSKVFKYGKTTVAGLTPLRFGGLDTNPRGYRVVQFKREGFDFELVPLGRGRRSPSRGSAAARTASVGSLVWDTDLPANTHRAAPVLWDGDLLVSLQDESSMGESGVCRVSAVTGEILWRVRTDSAVRNSVTVTDGDSCLALTSAGRLYKIDATSGEVRWQLDTAGFPERWMATSPAVRGDVVYVGAKSGYAAFDLESGGQLWDTRFVGTYDLIADPLGDKWGCYASPLVFEDLLVAFVPRRGLVTLDRSTGRVAWEPAFDGAEDYWAAPILASDLLVSGGEPGKLIVVAPRSGEVLWHDEVIGGQRPSQGNPSLSYASGLASDQGRIYAATSQGEVVCCDLQTGQAIWTFQTGHDLLDMTPGRRGVRSLLAAPVVSKDSLLVSALDGVLYKLDTATGEQLGETRFDAPLTSPPCLMADGFAVTTWNGRLFRYRL